MTPAGPWDADVASDERAGAEPTAAGHRVRSTGGDSAVAVDVATVPGGDGGTTAVSGSARFVADRTTLWVGLPFVVHRGTDGTLTGLGNLVGGALAPVDGADGLSLGAEIGIPVDRTYTWVNRAEEIWPSVGVDGVAQLHRAEGAVELVGRGALGLHTSPGVAPMPSIWPRVAVAGLASVRFLDVARAGGELSLAYWDTSPVELSGFGEVVATEGVRVRGLVVLPLAAWVGAQPADVPAGLRETTFGLGVELSP